MQESVGTDDVCDKCGKWIGPSHTCPVPSAAVAEMERDVELRESLSADMDHETRIMCHTECRHRHEDGRCTATAIHLQPCAAEADNVLCCSEWKEVE